MSCSDKNNNNKKKKTRRDAGVIPVHFLRIVLGDGYKFNMPKNFVREYGKGLSESAIIQAPTGPRWEVELIRGDGLIWFGNGWKEFEDYFSLKTGSSLVFRYEGDSRFNVLFIFDSDALETNYPNYMSNREDVNREVRPQISKVEETKSGHDSAGVMSKIPGYKKMGIEEVVETESDDDSDGIMGGNIPTHDKRMAIQEVIEIESDHDSAGTMGGNIPTYKRPGIQDKQNVRRSGESSRNDELKFQMPRKYRSKNGISPVEEASRGTSASRRCKSFEAPRKMQSLVAKREAKALRKDANFKTDHPFFEVVIKPSHLTRPELYVPVTLQRHLTATADVVLQNMDGRTWSVAYKVYEQGCSGRFQSGWKDFVRDNKLQEGDTCRFELQKGLRMCFTVSISRVDENANQHFTAGHVGGKRCLKITGSQFESGCSSKYEGMTLPCTSKESNVPKKKIKTEHGMFPQVMRGDTAAALSIRRFSSKGTVRAFERARKLKSNHPSFKLVITARFLHKSMPTVPSSFYKEYLKCISQGVMLQIKEKFWSVRLLANSAGQGKLVGGWHKFALENKLKVADVCVFEMINANPIVFKVTIFSGSSG